MSYKEQALDILGKTPLIDGHNDWPHLIRGFYDNAIENSRFTPDTELVGHVDLKRLLKGKSGGVFLAAYVDCPSTDNNFSDETHLETVRDTLQQIDLIHRLVQKYDHALAFADSAADIQPIHGAGKVACLIGVEGLHQIGNSASVLRMYHRLGVRYVTLTHNENNLYADSATALAIHGGLSDKGKDMVIEMNRIGMLIDLSHTSEKTAEDVLDISIAPVAFTHSSVKQLCAHERNVNETCLDKLKKNGGILMISFVPQFTLVEKSEAAVEHVVQHIRYVADRIGFDYIGIGSDYDGLEKTVRGLEDISTFPELVSAMLASGMARVDVEKVIGLNLIRVLSEVEKVAADQGKTLPVAEDKVKQLWSDDVRAYVRKVYPDAA